MWDMRHLAVESLECFRKHRTLKATPFGLGGTRRNAEAIALLGREERANITVVRKSAELR